MPEALDSSDPVVYWSLGISPVQSWIAEARRSRDLLVGSRLLALLMGDLLATLKSAGAELLLPHVGDEDLRSLQGNLEAVLSSGTSAVSNRASGRWASNVDSVRKNLAVLEERLQERWFEIRDEVETSARRSAGQLWDRIGSQVGRPDCPFHLVWVAQEVAGDDREGLGAVDRLYAAVKRSRPIRPHGDGAPVRKCGQCGRREAMGGSDPKTWRRFQRQLADLPEVRHGLRIDVHEYLCSVCALRRLAGYLRESSFPSTSAIASRDWLWKVQSVADLRSALRSLEDAAAEVPRYQPSWADRAPLYYRRTAERELGDARSDGDQATATALERVLAAQKKLGDQIQRYNWKKTTTTDLPSNPPEYLAVLFFDGDDLGRRLREDLERLPPRVREFQDRLAAELGNPQSDRLGLGEPFYLGGDEGLVLVPAGSALGVATAVRELWQEVFREGIDQPPTVSAGIALFDRERPLGAAITEAHQALEAAKGMDGKDALAVSVQTASGSAWSVSGRWDEDWSRLAAAVDLIRDDELSAGWPHDVEAFLRSLPMEAFRGDERMRQAIRQEVKRLTLRRTGPESRRSGEREGSAAEKAWRRLKGDSWWLDVPPEEVLSSLPEQLHLVSFLVRQARTEAA